MRNREVDSACLNLCVAPICINLAEPQVLKKIFLKRHLSLVLKIILLTLLIFFDLKNRTQKHQLSEVRILRVNHLVRCARLFGLMTCNSRFVLSYLGFFLGFPSKMSHCVAFECSNQAKTKWNPRLPFSSFPKDHIQLTTCMDSC